MFVCHLAFDTTRQYKNHLPFSELNTFLFILADVVQFIKFVKTLRVNQSYHIKKKSILLKTNPQFKVYSLGSSIGVDNIK